ncbi:MAG TPA: hypothetical protein VGF99_15770, partial [Myxococcota bacterium]
MSSRPNPVVPAAPAGVVDDAAAGIEGVEGVVVDGQVIEHVPATLVARASTPTHDDTPAFDEEAVHTIIELAGTGKTTIAPRPSQMPLVDVETADGEPHVANTQVLPTPTPRTPDGDSNTIIELAAGARTSLVSLRLKPSAPTTPSMPVSSSSNSALRYELVGEIGHGGGGDVFEVKDTDLRRNVALKRLRREHTDPGLLTLFLQEAQLTAQLEHPNIVPVHELGATATGEPFFTMKRVTGQTLHDVLLALRVGDAAAAAR